MEPFVEYFIQGLDLSKSREFSTKFLQTITDCVSCVVFKFRIKIFHIHLVVNECRKYPDQVRAVRTDLQFCGEFLRIRVFIRLKVLSEDLPTRQTAIVGTLHFKSNRFHFIGTTGSGCFRRLVHDRRIHNGAVDLFFCCCHRLDHQCKLFIGLLCHIQFTIYEHIVLVVLCQPIDCRRVRVSVVKTDDPFLDPNRGNEGRNDVQIFTEFSEELPVKHIPVTFKEGTPFFIRQHLQCLDIFRLCFKQDLVVPNSRRNEFKFFRIFVFLELPVNPYSFDPSVSFSSRVG